MNIFIFIIVFFALEVVFRVKILGLNQAITSFFHPVQQPSVLGTADWIISDEEMNYRLNPARDGVNSFSIVESEIEIPKPSGVIRILVLGDSLPLTGNPTFVELLKDINR